MTVLREGFDYAFSRLDPMSAHIDPPSIAVYDTLLVKGPDRRAYPCLAQVVGVADSQLEWTLRLRPGATFHSGAPCDAAAVVASLEALRWHVPGDRQLWYWDPVDTVSAVDDATVRFRLHHPYRRFPALLWGTHTAVFNRAEQLADPDRFGSTVCDGTGPFRAEHADDQRVVARRNDGYPVLHVPGLRPEVSSLDRVEWVAILDPAERAAALVGGDVHCVHGVDYRDVESLRTDPRLLVYEGTQSSSMYLSLSWLRKDLGFDDVRMRTAVSSAIDRTALVSQALHGHGRPTWGPLPPGSEHYDPSVDDGRGVDPGSAAGLLSELGWERGPDGVRVRDGDRLAFECVVQDDPVFLAVARLVEQQLAAAGIELQLRPVRPFADFYEACRALPASSISKWLWQDPVDALIGFSSTSTAPFPNWASASVPALDALFGRWLRADTEEEHASVASDIQHLFARTLPYVPLLTPHDVWAWRREVHGYSPSPETLYPLYQGVDLTEP